MESWLVLEPLDTFAARDGRAFDAGVHAVARATAPQPATVAGAVGAAFGAPPGAGADRAQRGRTVPAEVRGPVVVREYNGRWLPLLAMPRDVGYDEQSRQWVRLKPDGDLDGVAHDLGGLRLLGGDGDGDVKDKWWTSTTLAQYLDGDDSDLEPTDEPWQVERRVGLARDDNRMAAEGMLYVAEHLRPAGRVGFAALCVDPPTRELMPSVPLGGEGRRARVHRCVDGVLPAAPTLPDPPRSLPHGRLLVYLATPAVFSHGWRPADEDLRGGELVAAAVGGPQVTAMSRPDRRTGGVSHGRLIWAVAPGSVYLLRYPDEQAALDAAAAWHGRTLPQADETLRTAGFGLALTGRW